MATAVEYGLIAALCAVVIITAITSVDQMKKQPPPPTPHCTTGLYVSHLGVCLTGATLPVYK